MAKEKEKPLTREDVLRLIEENGGTAKGLDLSGREFEEGIDLREFNLSEIILREATLKKARLEGAQLVVAYLEGADLWGANLERANLSSANLQKALLLGANLQEAYLRDANLQEAYLTGANLQEANLRDANLQKANLAGANLQKALLFSANLQKAHLRGANLQEANLRDANLQEADLIAANLTLAYLSWAKWSFATELEHVDWGRDYMCGEEIAESFNTAQGIYRSLEKWHTEHGMYDIAARFYYREKEANRKALKLCSKHWNDRLAAEFMRAFFGYGERWWNILFWIVAVIFGLAAAYHFWGSFSSSSFWDILYYSAASFTALGYGQWAPQPTGWAKGMGAAEAIIGVFMMALLLVTFVRKWTR